MWDLIVSVPDHCLSFYFEVPFATENKAHKQSPTRNIGFFMVYV